MTQPLSKPFPEERRWATVLFADVQGFTALAEKLDFEVVSDLIKDIWVRLDTIISEHGGYVDKHLGDGVMAVWGAPNAGENDAEQAVSAGLALQESLIAYAKSSEQTGGRKLEMRVGINTGHVLAGYVGVNDEYTVMGDTVNVASRLEQHAEAGTVLISESTFRLVRGRFKFRARGALSIKGKTQKLLGFVVAQKSEQTSNVRYRSDEILNTHMVGREYEFQKLSAFYNQAKRSNNPTLVMVAGELGIGKSRLLMEFASHLDISTPNFNLLSARALSQTALAPFFVWKSLWQNQFGITDLDAPEIERKKFETGIRNLSGLEIDTPSSIETAQLIGSLISVTWPDSKYLASYENDSATRISKAFQLTRELLRRTCKRGPTVLLLDDLHWSDNLSLDLLSYLVKPGPEPFPLMIITGARTSFLREHPKWMNVSNILYLGPLPINAEIVSLAYPDLEPLPREVRAELARRSDGNPYFLEELVRGLIKADLVDRSVEPQKIVELLTSQTPESLQAMLQSRLDSLPREARMVALIASIVGRVFWVGPVLAAIRSASHTGTGLLKLSPSVSERVVQDGLRKLVQAELAFPRTGTSFSDDQEYIFKHSLLRDVAYGLIPHKYLSQYHMAVARWVISRPDSKFQVMAADHFEKAGALFEAARQYDHAARYATSRGAKDEAKRLLVRAQTLREKMTQPNI